MPKWSYKFVISERFKNGVWYTISEDDKQIDPRPCHDYLNLLGSDGWELVTVVPIGETAMMYAEDFTGKVVGIADGDTITVLYNGRGEKIRLNAIDCPENGQAFGKRAKQTASELAFGQEVIVETFGLDKYGRTIGDVTLPDGKSLNRELVRAGLCWWYRKYAPNDRELEKLEVQARSDKRGLWAEPHPIPPWTYRKLRRGQGLDTSDLRIRMMPMFIEVKPDRFVPVEKVRTKTSLVSSAFSTSTQRIEALVNVIRDEVELMKSLGLANADHVARRILDDTPLLDILNS